MRRPTAPLPDDPTEAANAAYLTGLGWLAGRELSSARVKARLVERGFPAPIADAAVRRLQECRALDDERAAAACARTLALVKRRGRQRVLRELERLGFDGDTARQALNSTLDDEDERRLAEQALDARLRGRSAPLEQRDRRRIFAALVRQGFPPSLIHDILRSRRIRGDESADD